MKCAVPRDKLLSYLLGELGERESEELRLHASSCSICSREIEAFARIAGDLPLLPRVEPGTSVWRRVEGAIANESAAPFRFWRPVAVGVAAAALCIMLVVRLSVRGPAPHEGETAIEELGSTIARTRIASAKIQDSLGSYFSDSHNLLNSALACARSGDESCWSAIKDTIAESDIIYRAAYLHERLVEEPGEERPMAAEQKALVENSMAIFKLIRERPPSTLAKSGAMIEEKAERSGMMEQLGKYRPDGRP